MTISREGRRRDHAAFLPTKQNGNLQNDAEGRGLAEQQRNGREMEMTIWDNIKEKLETSQKTKTLKCVTN